ncbi:MAG: hypothetical protein GY928_09755 [Colwellia sp.]|nr:hypothetical protein [Colwellia sp.]
MLFGFFTPLLAISIFWLLMVPSVKERGLNIGYPIVISILLWMILCYYFILFTRRLKEPIEVHVDEEKVLAIFNDGKMIAISWVDIFDITVNVSCRRKKVKITSKDKSKEIILYGELKKYDFLIETIKKYTSNERHGDSA